MDVSSGFPLPLPAAFGPRTRQLALPLLRQIAKLRRLQHLYSRTQHLTGLEFIAALLRDLRVTVRFNAGELRHIPLKGAFIAVANHPSGLLDGLVLLHVLGQVRPEIRVVANEVLAPLLTQLNDQFVLVQPDAEGRQRNMSKVRYLLRLLHNDVPLLLFPAGMVAHRATLLGTVAEPDWNPTAGRLMAAARVPVLPIWLSGQNSASFNWLGLIHPLLRTLRLPAELLNKRNTTIHVRIGAPVHGAHIQKLPDASLLPFLRARVAALASSTEETDPELAALPILAETNAAELTAELSTLRSKRKLVVHGQWEVYVAKACEIPLVLREIGRLRELTFRREGEGTQQPCDLDRYDAYYRHLFLYDRRAGRLVGAYRLGPGRSILREFGRPGFYLHSLFRLKKELKPLLRQSLELGRSFIREEYQREPLPLLLLWKGIAAYLSTHTEYCYLIGPVSISNRFSTISKAVMVDFIRRHCFDAELGAHVQPRKQFRYHPPGGTASTSALQTGLDTVEALNQLIGALEPSGMGVPVLLRHYIRQNARFIGFNLDPLFSNTLDGFIVLHASALPERTHRLLERYGQVK